MPRRPAGDVEERRVGQVWVVAFHGELDIAAVPGLRTEVRDRLRHGVRVVVDLSDADFIDTSILGVLVASHREAEAASTAFAIVPPVAATPLHRMLSGTGVLAQMHTYGSAAAAVAALG